MKRLPISSMTRLILSAGARLKACSCLKAITGSAFPDFNRRWAKAGVVPGFSKYSILNNKNYGGSKRLIYRVRCSVLLETYLVIGIDPILPLCEGGRPTREKVTTVWQHHKLSRAPNQKRKNLTPLPVRASCDVERKAPIKVRSRPLFHVYA